MIAEASANKKSKGYRLVLFTLIDPTVKLVQITKTTIYSYPESEGS